MTCFVSNRVKVGRSGTIKNASKGVLTGTDTVCLLQVLCHFSAQVATEVGRWNPSEKPKEVEPLITPCTLRKSYLIPA